MLSVAVDKIMYVAYKSGHVVGYRIVRESKSGDMVQTKGGRVMRCDTKHHKIFNSERDAIIQAEYWLIN